MNTNYFNLLCFLLVVFTSVNALEKIKPHFWKEAETARWLAHENIWGSLATISVRMEGLPFVQPKSFSDGNETSSTGNLYFYESALDESMKDIETNSVVSFSVSAASLGHCIPTAHTDPENPTCAKATFTGTFELVTDEQERELAKDALFSRHPMMPTWPHDFDFYTIRIKSIWLIDIYGGAKEVDPMDYYSIELKEIPEFNRVLV